MNRINAFEALMLRAACSALSLRRRSESLLVLIFHRVLAAPDSILRGDPDAATFAAQMDLLRELFTVVPLGEALDRLAQGSLPPRAVSITFDDGYANNCEIAAPILAERGMSATFFIATGYLEGGRMWNDTVIESIRRAPQALDLDSLGGLGRYDLTSPAARANAAEAVIGKLKYHPPADRERKAREIAAYIGQPLPDDLMMTHAQVRRLLELGMELGAHTVTHPILAQVAPEEARREIADSRAQLEAIIRIPVRLFAYPNGRPVQDYGPEHVKLVRAAGFDHAVSTSWGCARTGEDRFQVPRIAPWDQTALRYGARMALTYAARRAQTV
jgi:peptidoglycan/xylan/chitin deacetylase (PgdA/CDA1 family)